MIGRLSKGSVRRRGGQAVVRRLVMCAVLALVVTLAGWHVVWQLYKKAPSVKGF